MRLYHGISLQSFLGLVVDTLIQAIKRTEFEDGYRGRTHPKEYLYQSLVKENWVV